MNYVFPIQPSQLSLLMEYYQEYVSDTENPNAIVTFRSPEVTVTIFRSLKVTVQGTQAREEYLMWADLLEFEPAPDPAEGVQSVPSASSPRSALYGLSAIGSDEVGTGDFFGPVVVCAAFVRKTWIPQLEEWNVRDSKQMTDEAMLALGPRLSELLPHVLLVVDNPKYNDLVRQGYNLNKMKAYLHNHAIKKCIAKVPSGFEAVIVDEFCPKDRYFEYLKDVEAYREITFRTQGESAHLSVAAASILARCGFLREMDRLNAEVGIRLPLGAGPVVDLIGKRIVLEKGFDRLSAFAKMNFKNVEKIQTLMKNVPR